MGCLPRICLCGDAFNEPLPSSGSMSQYYNFVLRSVDDAWTYTYRDVRLTWAAGFILWPLGPWSRVSVTDLIWRLVAHRAVLDVKTVRDHCSCRELNTSHPTNSHSFYWWKPPGSFSMRTKFTADSLQQCFSTARPRSHKGWKPLLNSSSWFIWRCFKIAEMI
jgi:hypothetical protein